MSYWVAGKRLSGDAFAKYIQAGEESISFTTQESFTQAVVFDTAFDAAPVVMVNISAAPSASARWDARAINVTSTGFDIFVFANASGSTSTWSAVPVQWQAVAR